MSTEQRFVMPDLPKMTEGQVLFLSIQARPPAPWGNPAFQQVVSAFVLTLCAKCQRRFADAEPRDDLPSCLELLCPDCNRGPKEETTYVLPEGITMKVLLQTKLIFEPVEKENSNVRS